jgi:hypothetical protein
MPVKRYAMWALLFSAMSLTGCCSWCERNCPNCHVPPPVQAAYPAPAPACGCAPATVSYPPAAVAAPVPQQMNCQCTCTPAYPR